MKYSELLKYHDRDLFMVNGNFHSIRTKAEIIDYHVLWTCYVTSDNTYVARQMRGIKRIRLTPEIVFEQLKHVPSKSYGYDLDKKGKITYGHGTVTSETKGNVTIRIKYYAAKWTKHPHFTVTIRKDVAFGKSQFIEIPVTFLDQVQDIMREYLAVECATPKTIKV